MPALDGFGRANRPICLSAWRNQSRLEHLDGGRHLFAVVRPIIFVVAPENALGAGQQCFTGIPDLKRAALGKPHIGGRQCDFVEKLLGVVAVGPGAAHQTGQLL